VRDAMRVDADTLPRLGLGIDEAPASLAAWASRVHPEDLGAFRAAVARALEVGDPAFDLEYRMASKDGAFHWFHSQGRVVQRALGGEPVLAVGTTMNITARRRAEEAARLSDERARTLAAMLRRMCDNVPDLIWAKDLEGRYLFANAAI
jgi:PAS domain-containing protein